MTTGIDHPPTRVELILQAAIEAFGRDGVAGASLRAIARDADVSLTLITHHFTNKAQLVQATACRLQQLADAPLARLRQSLEGDAAPTLESVVAAWTRYAIDLFGHRARRPHLRLLLRLQIDPAVDATTASSLDVAAPHVRRALAKLYPAAAHEDHDFAWRCASAALQSALLEEPRLSAQWPGCHERTASVRNVVMAILAAALDAPPRAESGVEGPLSGLQALAEPAAPPR